MYQPAHGLANLMHLLEPQCFDACDFRRRSFSRWGFKKILSFDGMLMAPEFEFYSGVKDQIWCIRGSLGCNPNLISSQRLMHA